LCVNVNIRRRYRGSYKDAYKERLVGVKIMKAKPDRTLDCLGLYCPEPIYRTRMELDNMKIGEVLEVTADDPAAEADIRSLVKRLGQELLNVSKEGNKVHFLIKKVK